MSPSTKYDILEEESIAALIQDQTEFQNKRRSQRVSNYLLWYSVFSTTVILILSIASFKMPVPSDYLNRPHTVPLGKHREYQSLDHSHDAIWNAVEDGAISFTAPDPNDGGRDGPATHAMFHQLHCLQSFRTAIQQAKEGIHIGTDWHDNLHWPHCFDYMRMTVMCWADDTIERRTVLPNGTLSPRISGYYDNHKCGGTGKLIQTLREAGRTVNISPFP